MDSPEINKKTTSIITVIIGILSSILAIAGFVIVMPFVMGVITMLIWNAVLPDLLGLPEIGYLQSVGLYFLSGILIKGDFSNIFSSITGIRMKKGLSNYINQEEE